MKQKEKEELMQAIKDQRELLQDDLICFLDGLPNSAVTGARQFVIDRMNALIMRLESTIVE